LGNHDYGEYVTWPSEKIKEANFQAIKDLYGQIGFKLMLNEHTYFKSDKIALIESRIGGIILKAGDINKASQNVEIGRF
jgi:hypothetical protein